MQAKLCDLRLPTESRHDVTSWGQSGRNFDREEANQSTCLQGRHVVHPQAYGRPYPRRAKCAAAIKRIIVNHKVSKVQSLIPRTVVLVADAGTQIQRRGIESHKLIHGTNPSLDCRCCRPNSRGGHIFHKHHLGSLLHLKLQ